MSNDLVRNDDGYLSGSQTPKKVKFDIGEYVSMPVEHESDKEILNYLSTEMTPYSEFQSEAFVINNEVTDHRKIQQVALEVRTRLDLLVEAEYALEKLDVKIRKLLRDIENEEDDLEKELLEIELKKHRYDDAQARVRMAQTNMEIAKFVKILKKIAPENTLETIQSYKENWEEKEKEYWAKRMGRQAMYDMLTTGKIGTGNLESIMQMPTEVQKATIAYALANSAKMEKGIAEIQDATRNLLISNEQHEKPFELPNITGITGDYGGQSTIENFLTQIGVEDVKQVLKGPESE